MKRTTKSYLLLPLLAFLINLGTKVFARSADKVHNVAIEIKAVKQTWELTSTGPEDVSPVGNKQAMPL